MARRDLSVFLSLWSVNEVPGYNTVTVICIVTVFTELPYAH
jgi:hypothetical protein